MINRKAFFLSSVALLVAGQVGLVAQVTTGSLAGKVTSPDGKPIAGARVSFESPALFQPRVLKTDAQGQFRGQLLPVGNYVIRVSADGWIGKTAENIRIGVGTNNQMDFALKAVQQQGAVVEVVGDSAAEAKTDDKVATNFSAEELTRLPTSRSWEGAAQLSPGVSGGGNGALNIRGGSSSGQSNAGGGGYSQVNYTVDGIDIKDDTGTSAARKTLYDPLPDSIEDIQVIQSQLNARFGRTSGGAVNIATKSGSNTFEGTVREFINRNAWTTNLSKGPVGGDLTQSEINALEGYSRYTDVTFSGPILKDRIWFFVGGRLQPKAYGSTRLGWGKPGTMQQTTDGGTTWNDLPGPWESYMVHPLTTWGLYSAVDNVLINRIGAPTSFGNPDLLKSDNNAIVPSDTKYDHYQAKISAQITPNNIVSLTYLYSNTSTSGTGFQFEHPPVEAIYKAFVGTAVTRTEAWTLNWNSSLSSNWFLEAKISSSELKSHDVSGPTTYPVFVYSQLGSGDPNVRLHVPEETQGWWGYGNRSAYFGAFATLRSSSSITPNIVGNGAVSINVKTFQHWKGQHDIDFGGEFFQTKHQFGRERNRNYGVMEGGFVRDYSKSPLDAAGYLFPVFYTADGSPLISPDDMMNDNLLLWNQTMMGASSHIEQYTVGGSLSKNNSTGLWINDTWTMNDRWNLMVGVRYNRFVLHDTNGKTQADNSILEPRLQLKFNPDGKNQEIYSFTAAKLASRYSDDFASYFRTNGWFSRVVRAWNGAGYSLRNPGDAQPPVLLNPGLGYDAGRYGVRWVTYAELISLDNYNPNPEQVIALDQTMRTQNLEVPYALEFSLGYTRNFETGSVRINFVQRQYKKDWVAFAHQGIYDPKDPTKYLTMVVNPVTGQPFSWNQTQPFINSEHTRTFQDVEISWVERIAARWTWGGNYTYFTEHGLPSELDYYNYRDEKLKLGIDPQVWGPTNTLLNKGQMLNAFLTYEVPVGKGNMSASILGKYYTGGRRSLVGYGNLNVNNPYATLPYNGVQLPVFAMGIAEGFNIAQQYSLYYGSPNGFTGGYDAFDVSLKLQAQIPLASRMVLLTEILVTNPFNHISQRQMYDWNNDMSFDPNVGSAPVLGRPLAQFNMPWGTANNANYYDAGRTVSFNIGLKF